MKHSRRNEWRDLVFNFILKARSDSIMFRYEISRRKQILMS